MTTKKLFAHYALLAPSFLLGAGCFAQGAPSDSKASSGSSRHSNNHLFYVGAGVLDHDAGEAANNASSGEKPFWGELYTELSLMMMIPVSSHLSVSPHIHYALPSKTSPEGMESITVYGYGVRLFYHLNDSFDFHLGPSILAYRISGSGGPVTLNNGAGTATFGSPSYSITSSVLCLDTGMGYSFSSRVRVDASILLSGFLTSIKRAMNPYITISVGL